MKLDYQKELHNRHLREETFHDQKAHDESTDNFYNHGAAWYAYEKMLKMAGDLHDKKVLDLGCGTGWASMIYAEQGAKVTGLDISEDTLTVAMQNARQRGLENSISFTKGSAEHIDFNHEFDIIIGIGILHHTDLNITSHSIHKALKPGGKALFMEPLCHNPLIRLFRWLTPWRRSKDERPLNINDIGQFKNNFTQVHYCGYNLISLIAFIFVPIKANNIFQKSIKFLNRCDDYLFKIIPGIQRYCWGVIIELKK